MTRTFTALTTFVLLACAGADRAAARDHRGGGPHAAAAARVKTGVWGGEHVRVEVSDTGATIEYDCGRGTIDEPIALDAQGHFDVQGRHMHEHGGPARRDEPPPAAARYAGRVRGDRMDLTVTVEDRKDPYGPFTLTRGNDVVLTKCR